jgi:hypothetical protein
MPVTSPNNISSVYSVFSTNLYAFMLPAPIVSTRLSVFIHAICTYCVYTSFCMHSCYLHLLSTRLSVFIHAICTYCVYTSFCIYSCYLHLLCLHVFLYTFMLSSPIVFTRLSVCIHAICTYCVYTSFCMHSCYLHLLCLHVFLYLLYVIFSSVISSKLSFFRRILYNFVFLCIRVCPDRGLKLPFLSLILHK